MFQIILYVITILGVYDSPGKSATGKSAVLSGRTFACSLMVALVPIDIGNSAALTTYINKKNGECKGKAEREF